MTASQGIDDIIFYSIYTEVEPEDGKGHHKWCKAIMVNDAPLKFFND